MEHHPDQHSLKCPKCHHGMVEVEHDEIVIDRCTNCHGLWFDDDEAHRLKALLGSEAVDTGDPTEGWKGDSHSEIFCPRCEKEMEKSADPKQKHIWYEMCREHGMFMDAGEFKDLKDESMLDWFRSLIKGDRRIVAP